MLARFRFWRGSTEPGLYLEHLNESGKASKERRENKNRCILERELWKQCGE